MCRIQFIDRKGVKGWLLMLGLNETIGQLAMACNVHWYGHVLRRALYFEVKCQRKKGRPIKTLMKQVVEESMNVGFNWEDAL